MAGTIVVRCGGCKQKLRVPGVRRGEIGRCPRCGTSFVVIRGEAVTTQANPSDDAPLTTRRQVLWAIGGTTAIMATGAGIYLAFREPPPPQLEPIAEPVPEPIPTNDPVNLDGPFPIRVACIGDAITAGTGLEKPAEQAYPAVLGRRLGSAFEVRGFAGSSLSVLTQASFPFTSDPAYKQAQEYEPRVVVMMLGTNDVWEENYRFMDQFVADYTRLVKSFQSLKSQPKIYLCTPPPAYPGASFDRLRIRVDVVPKVRQVATELQLPVIDIFAVMSGEPDLFQRGLYPTAAGADKIAEAVGWALVGKK